MAVLRSHCESTCIPALKLWTVSLLVSNWNKRHNESVLYCVIEKEREARLSPARPYRVGMLGDLQHQAEA